MKKFNAFVIGFLVGVLFAMLILLNSGCSKHYCPTYGVKNRYEKMRK